MKIHTAKSAGFCFGVKRALAIALDTAASCRKVCMLGDIVHNENVVRQVERAGIVKIQRLGAGAGKTLIIRAHGAGRATFREARRRGYRIIDATCPMVKEIHTIAQALEDQGRTVIVIGDRLHDEVRGITGRLKKKAIIVDTARNLPAARLRGVKKAGVIVQSTQNLEDVSAIVRKLNGLIPDLEFHNTICRPTRIKQDEIKKIPLKNDVMIIIGSRHSANTKRLYEITKNLNKHSHWINAADELRPAWFRGAKNVGVTAGASTPESTIREVVAEIACRVES